TQQSRTVSPTGARLTGARVALAVLRRRRQARRQAAAVTGVVGRPGSRRPLPSWPSVSPRYSGGRFLTGTVALRDAPPGRPSGLRAPVWFGSAWVAMRRNGGESAPDRA